jgi:Spy/CpxP family protein refolding chaperone
MNVGRTWLIAVVALLVFVPQTAAQGYKWWQDEKSQARLSLTVEQAQKIEEIFQQSMPKLRAGYDELSRREKQFSRLLQKADLTEAEVMRQADQVESVRGDLNKARTLMLFRMNRILTAEQRVKLEEMHARGERGRPREPVIKKRLSGKD